MIILNEAGKRLFKVNSPDPQKIPNIEIWSGNHKDCIFCKNCQIALDIRNPKKPALKVSCKLPSVSPNQGNCDLHHLNKNHTCASFDDIDKSGKTVLAVKKPVEEKKPEIASFSLSKDGVEQINKK